MSDDLAPGGEAQNETPTPPADSNWVDTIPETYREWDEVKNAKSPEDFWKQIDNQRSLIGRSVQIPTGDASDEDRSKFFDRMKQHFPDITKVPDLSDPETLKELRRNMGMPEEAKGYASPEVEIPEGVDLDPSTLEVFKDMAHEAGLTQDQHNQLVSKIMNDRIAEESERVRRYNDKMTDLRKDWGAAYDDKYGEAEKIRKEFFDFIPSDKMNAETLRAFDALAKQFGAENPSLTATADQVRKTSLTPSEAKQRAAEIMNNKNGPYWQVSDPLHHQVRDQYRKLMEIAVS